MFGLGPLELVLVIFVVLVIFGAKRLPNLMRGIGKGIRNFRRELPGVEADEDQRTLERRDEKISGRR